MTGYVHLLTFKTGEKAAEKKTPLQSALQCDDNVFANILLMYVV